MCPPYCVSQFSFDVWETTGVSALLLGSVIQLLPQTQNPPSPCVRNQQLWALFLNSLLIVIPQTRNASSPTLVKAVWSSIQRIQDVGRRGSRKMNWVSFFSPTYLLKHGHILHELPLKYNRAVSLHHAGRKLSAVKRYTSVSHHILWVFFFLLTSCLVC